MTDCPLGLGTRCYCANQVSSFAAQGKTAVLLLAHGSPENPGQIPEFLRYVTGGRPLPPRVIEEIRHRHSLIGFSPLACWTLRQGDHLSRLLKMPVFVGMRNWKPFIADAVKAITRKGFERVIAMLAFFFVTNYMLSFISLFVLRSRDPQAERPYRAWGYPWTTAIALLGSVAFLIEAIREDRANSVLTLIALACSYPVYRVLKSVSSRSNPNEAV